jgi:hypothetical protein
MNVEQWQCQQQPILFGPMPGACNRRAIRHQVGVGEHRSLRSSGCARCIPKERNIVRCRRRCPIGHITRFLQNNRVGANGLGVFLRLADQIGLGLIADNDHARLGVAQDMAQFGVTILRVDQYHNCADHMSAQVCSHERRAVLQVECDAVTAFNAGGAQAGRPAGSGCGNGSIGVSAPFKQQKWTVRRMRHRPLQRRDGC